MEDLSFPVVGVGASAGGIEALGDFFDAMPIDSGCAFVVVLHLDPNRESEMARVLASRTRMPVVQVEDGMSIASGHVYVIAPDTELRLRDGRLLVSKPSERRGERHPVDVLFASIAVERRERAIAIVLSGTGSNGTQGLKEIRAEGGMSLVQTPETAKFDGMPQSAIAADLADHVLAPADMPEVVLRYTRHGYLSDPEQAAFTPPRDQTTIDQILDLLRVRSGSDFRSYRKTTLQRRIHRRMGLRNVGKLDDYLQILHHHAEEAATLAADLMISVTGFFRDAEAWEALSELVFAPLVAERDSGATIRVWVPACATGEEAYSVAILLTELADAAGRQFDIKVFATDAQDANLRRARDGIYPAAALAGFAPERTRRFFEKLGGLFQVRKELRDMVVFAGHDLLRDPPFSRLDLVSCRNLLIYLEPDAQQRIVALCHFALRQDGHLFLGNAETVGRHEDLFETVSKKWRIYRRVGPTRHDLIDYSQSRVHTDPAERRPAAPLAGSSARLGAITRNALLTRFAPAAVLIDQKGGALYFHGATGDYLEHPNGEPTRDLPSMARNGLALKLRAAIRTAVGDNAGVSVDAWIRQGGTARAVAMTVTPLAPLSPTNGLLLVSFAPRAPTADPARTDPPQPAEEPWSGARALQEELTTTRAELRSIIEQLETANEELSASNAEAASINEELQSANEELETSKEELQSFNEELNTVNNQLQHKIGELEGLSNDLNNLLAGSEIAILFLDEQLCIKWFAPAIRDLFDLVSSDIGRPIAHFARKFFDDDLLSDAEKVLEKLTSIEVEVPGESGRWFLRRMLPYRTRDNRVAGVVVMFSDITDRKCAAEAVDEARLYAEAIVGTIRQTLLVLTGALRVRSANAAFYEMFKVTAKQSEDRLLYELGNGLWDIPRLRALLDGVLPDDRAVVDFEVEHHFRDLGWRSLMLNARKLVREGAREELILLAIEDITERRRGKVALRASEAQYRTLFESIDEGFCIIEQVETDPGAPIDFRYLEANPAFERHSGIGGVVGKTIREVFPGEPQEWFDTFADLLDGGEPTRFERALATQGRMLEVYAFRLGETSQRRVAMIFNDITDRQHAEDASRRLAAIVRSSGDAIISKDITGIVTSWNEGAERLFGYSGDEIIGKSITTLIPPDRHDEETGILDRLRRGENIEHYETIRRRKDGSEVWVSLTVSPLLNAHGQVVGASKIARDMTERHDADRHRKVLLDELNHRVKNTLAIVQSIASQTFGQTSSIEEGRAAFGARLINLAKAHDVLTRENWAGADLAEIVGDTVGPYSAEQNRFRIEGPHIQLAPRAALAVSMALHELGTNAAKYGALSTDDGRVAIGWGIEGEAADRRLALRWEESDGPPVVPPSRKGFGSRLIERLLAAELGGEVRMEYRTSGLVCSIDAPMPWGSFPSDGRSPTR